MIWIVERRDRQHEVEEVVAVDAGLAGRVQSEPVEDRIAVIEPIGQLRREVVCDQAEPERGHGDTHECEAGEHVIGYGVLTHRAVDADEQGDDRRDHDAPDDELHRVPERGLDLVADRLAALPAIAEVTLDHTRQPVAVLRDKRTVEAEVLAQLGAHRGCISRLRDARGRIERRAHHPEHEERRKEQHRDRIDRAAQHVDEHDVSIAQPRVGPGHIPGRAPSREP